MNNNAKQNSKVNISKQIKGKPKNIVDWVTIVLIVLVSLAPFTPTRGLVKNNPTSAVEVSKYYYPKTYSLPNSLPYAYFNVGNSIHVRNTETGMVESIFQLSAGEDAIMFDEDSMFTYQINSDGNKKDLFCRYDLDGEIEEFEMSHIDSTPIRDVIHNHRIQIYNDEIYRIVIKKTYSQEEIFENILYVESKKGVLWKKTAEKGHMFNFQKGDHTQGLNTVYIADVSGHNEDIVAFELLTGKELFKKEGIFVNHTSWNQWKTQFLYIQPDVNDINKTEIIDSRTGELLYSGDRSYTPYLLDNVIWITSVSQSNWYKYGESNPIKIIKIDESGEILEEIQFNPRILGRSFNNCKIISDNIAVLTDKNYTGFFNFHTNQQLYECPRTLKNAYVSGSYTICEDDFRLFALDKYTFEILWELEAIESHRVDIVESETQYFIGYKSHNLDSDCLSRADYPECKTLHIKVINKADMSVEPYEYEISPCIYDMGDLVPSKFGLLFIGRNTVSLYRPNNNKLHDIRFMGEITNHKISDDPRYIELTYTYSKSGSDLRTVIFDVKTGLYKEK